MALLFLTSSSMTQANQKLQSGVDNKYFFKDLSLGTFISKLYADKQIRIVNKTYDFNKFFYFRNYNIIDYDGRSQKRQSIEALRLLKSIKYTNRKGDVRYLVIIEGLGHSMDASGNLIGETCHVCSPSADLYLFEKLKDQGYHLITQSDKKAPIQIGSYGVSNLSEDESVQLVDISPSEKALLVKTSYSQMDETSEGIVPIALIENKTIAKSKYIEISGSSAAMDESAQYIFNSNYYIAKEVDQGKFYPIIVTYNGTNYDELSNKVVPFNIKRIYNIERNRYVLKQK